MSRLQDSHKYLIDNQLKSTSVLINLVTQLAQETTPTPEAKAALSYLGGKLGELKNTDCKQLCTHTLE